MSKESGLPTISELWRSLAEQAAKANDVHSRMIDVDVIAYRLIQKPRAFDVIAPPNLVGDVCADLGAVLLGSPAYPSPATSTEPAARSTKRTMVPLPISWARIARSMRADICRSR